MAEEVVLEVWFLFGFFLQLFIQHFLAEEKVLTVEKVTSTWFLEFIWKKEYVQTMWFK